MTPAATSTGAALTPSWMSIQCIDMERKDKVLNVRVTEGQRVLYERAAALAGTSVSALVTSAADAHAGELLRAELTMTVPSDVFDNLVAALDQPARLAPSLEKALLGPRFEHH